MTQAPWPAALTAVLLVEDDDATAELERRFLSRSGFEVRRVASVAQAVSALRVDSFLAVLLDYQLPDGDPWTIVDAAQSRTPPLPVILITAMGNELVVTEALQHGVTDYVKKTGSFWEALPATLERALKLHRVEEQLHRASEMFRLISENTSDMIAITGPQLTIRYVSPACGHFFGRAPQALDGMSLQDLVHPDDRPQLDGLRSLSPAQSRMTSTFRCLRLEGSPLWVESTFNARFDPGTGRIDEVVQVARDITERRAAQARLEASLREKDSLLKEVHHRVKNNMQVISSLLQLQSGEMETPEARQALTASQNRIRSMALIHEKLYENANLADVDFADYVRRLVSMREAQGGTEVLAPIKVHAAPVTIGIDRAIPAGLLLNELISHCFARGSPDGRSARGEITLELRGDGQVRLSVRDNRPVPDEGPGSTSAQPLGLQLVRILAEQLGGSLAFEYRGGFVCEVVFGQAPSSI